MKQWYTKIILNHGRLRIVECWNSPQFTGLCWPRKVLCFLLQRWIHRNDWILADETIYQRFPELKKVRAFVDEYPELIKLSQKREIQIKIAGRAFQLFD